MWGVGYRKRETLLSECLERFLLKATCNYLGVGGAGRAVVDCLILINQKAEKGVPLLAEVISSDYSKMLSGYKTMGAERRMFQRAWIHWIVPWCTHTEK